MVRRKITWRMIHTDFKKNFPNLSKHVVYWSPYDQDQIVVYLEEGSKLIYDYVLKTCAVLKERWKE